MKGKGADYGAVSVEIEAVNKRASGRAPVVLVIAGLVLLAGSAGFGFVSIQGLAGSAGVVSIQDQDYFYGTTPADAIRGDAPPEPASSAIQCTRPATTTGYSIDSEVLDVPNFRVRFTPGNRVGAPDFGIEACGAGYAGTPAAVACSSAGEYTLSGCTERARCSTMINCADGWSADSGRDGNRCAGPVCDPSGTDNALCCRANTCTCTSGTAAVTDGTDGTLCDTDNEEDCSECDSGYALSSTAAAGSAQTCVERAQCSTMITCADGWSADSGRDGNLCAGAVCDPFGADNALCCKANTCTCTSGTAAVTDGTDGTLCDTDNEEDCSECDFGYALSSTAAAGSAQTCVERARCSTMINCADGWSAFSGFEHGNLCAGAVCDPFGTDNALCCRANAKCSTLYHLCTTGTHSAIAGDPSCAAASCVQNEEACCTAHPCDASAVIANADNAGGCTANLASGATCTQTGNTGFICTASSCSEGTLTAGTCSACADVMNADISVADGTCVDCDGPNAVDCADASCAAGYHGFGDGLLYISHHVNINECPTDSRKLVTKAECDAAGAALGYGVSTRERNRLGPTGCYETSTQQTSTRVYFNTHATGGPNGNATPICGIEAGCSANTCSCANGGTAATGAACTTDNADICTACTGEFYLDGSSCAACREIRGVKVCGVTPKCQQDGVGKAQVKWDSKVSVAEKEQAKQLQGIRRGPNKVAAGLKRREARMEIEAKLEQALAELAEVYGKRIAFMQSLPLVYRADPPPCPLV